MTPRAIKYGPRYYWDRNFRRRMRNRESNERSKEKYGSGYLSSKKYIKFQLISRNGNICQLCRRTFPYTRLTIDHKIKVTKGGTHELSQLQLLCRRCHDFKDNPSPFTYPYDFNESNNLPFKYLFEEQKILDRVMNLQIEQRQMSANKPFLEIKK